MYNYSRLVPEDDQTTMARRTKEEAERTYHALLDAAAALFMRHGVARTTLVDVAADAGMTRGAVYHHFSSKERLVMALWERDGDSLGRALEGLADQINTANPAKSFRTEIKFLMNRIVTEPNLAQAVRIVIHNVEFTDEKTELQHYLASRKQAFLRALEQSFGVLQKADALKSRLSPGLIAFSLLSYLYGLIHNHLTPDGINLDLHRSGEDLVDLFLDGVLQE